MKLISTTEYQYWPQLSPYHVISNTSTVSNCIIHTMLNCSNWCCKALVCCCCCTWYGSISKTLLFQECGERPGDWEGEYEGWEWGDVGDWHPVSVELFRYCVIDGWNKYTENMSCSDIVSLMAEINVQKISASSRENLSLGCCNQDW